MFKSQQLNFLDFPLLICYNTYKGGEDMENTGKTKYVFRLTKNVKNICINSGGGIFIFLLLLVMLLMNPYCLPGLFRSDNFFPPDGIYSLMLSFLMICVLLGIILLTPHYLRNNKTEEGNEIPANLRIFSLWLPIFLCIMLQTAICIVCALISKHFNVSIFVILFVGILLGILAYVWIIICSAVFYVSKLIRWYITGLSALYIAPIFIHNVCRVIYSATSITPYTRFPEFILYLNPVVSAPLIFRGAISMIIFFVLGIAGIIAVSIFIQKKRYNTEKIGIITLVYKKISILLLSVAFGLFWSRGFLDRTQLSAKFIISFLISTVLTALLLSYFAFRKDRLKFRMGIILSAVAVFFVVILCGIPALARMNAYKLPSPKEISSIRLVVGSFGAVDMDKYFEECNDLNLGLLKLTEEGKIEEKKTVTSSDPLLESFTDPILSACCRTINFEYTLKNGKRVYRSYSDLYGEAVEKYVIEFLKSDAFAYGLQKTKIENSQMLRYSGRNVVSRCSIPDYKIKELLEKYCEELKNAPDSAFYEGCLNINLSGNYYTEGYLYVPRSFTETKKLVETYFKELGE